MPGSTFSAPQPGRFSGNSAPSVSMPEKARHSGRFHPIIRSTSAPFTTRITVGTISIPS